MAKQNWGEILKYGVILAGGFVAVKVALAARDKIAAGGKAIDSIVSAAGDFAQKALTEDLNPASDKNVVNRAVNSVVSAATGREETLGGWFNDKFGKGADVKKMLNGDTSKPSNLKEQASTLSPHTNNDDFRRAEITAENADTKAFQTASNVSEIAKSNFRIDELLAGSESRYPDSGGAIFGVYPKP